MKKETYWNVEARSNENKNWRMRNGQEFSSVQPNKDESWHARGTTICHANKLQRTYWGCLCLQFSRNPPVTVKRARTFILFDTWERMRLLAVKPERYFETLANSILILVYNINKNCVILSSDLKLLELVPCEKWPLHWECIHWAGARTTQDSMHTEWHLKERYMKNRAQQNNWDRKLNSMSYVNFEEMVNSWNIPTTMFVSHLYDLSDKM